jgi:hypothetical protein
MFSLPIGCRERNTQTGFRKEGGVFSDLSDPHTYQSFVAKLGGLNVQIM